MKQQRLRRLAAAWLADNGVHGVEVRFDVAAVTGDRLEVDPGGVLAEQGPEHEGGGDRHGRGHRARSRPGGRGTSGTG